MEMERTRRVNEEENEKQRSGMVQSDRKRHNVCMRRLSVIHQMVVKRCLVVPRRFDVSQLFNRVIYKGKN